MKTLNQTAAALALGLHYLLVFAVAPLTAHLPQIRDSHPQRSGRRKPGDGRDSGIMLRMNFDGKDRAVILPLQKDKDGYAFVLDTEAFSQCKNLPE